MDSIENLTSLEEILCERANQERLPIGGSLELLPLCNMNCDMCYVRLSQSDMESQGGLRTLQEWVTLAREMKDAGVLFLLLTGGEPFLYPDFKILYLELQKLGMILTINTNGTLINEELADFLGQHKPRRVNVTLYGSDDHAYTNLCHYPGGFEKAIRGIRLLRQRGVDVKINGSLVKANREDADKITAIARSLNSAVNIDTYMYPATRERNRPFNQQARLNPEEAAKARIHLYKKEKTPTELRKFALGMFHTVANTSPGEEIAGRVACRAGRSSFTINWQGHMRPCVMLSNPSIPVFTTGFAVAWEQMVHIVDKISLSSKCSRCTLRKVCKTCAACALLEEGDFGATPNYMCQYTQYTLNFLADELKNL